MHVNNNKTMFHRGKEDLGVETPIAGVSYNISLEPVPGKT